LSDPDALQRLFFALEELRWSRQMSLTLYFHPLASFCHKVLIALYEKGIAFDAKIVDLVSEDERAKYLELWPVGKIPVLRDEDRNRTVPETTIIIEYLDRFYPGAVQMFPSETERRLDARLWDRFFDQYVSVPMQKIVGDRLRAEGELDPKGVADAHATLATAYEMLDRHLRDKTWTVGETFGVAECAAAPALFYADTLRSVDAHPHLSAYFDRLMSRPSVARTLAEARPYFKFYPYRERLKERFLRDA
jgi:glutathione S-transferase